MTVEIGFAGQEPQEAGEPARPSYVKEITRLAIGTLAPGPQARLGGQSNDHVRMLAESSAALPPIIVQRSTLRVIDGMHRLRAATLRGDTEISVQFYDGDDDDAFVLAVEANIAHGLPLSLADRSAAAEQIVQSHPYWSDRRIASVTGLAPRTVGGIRSRTAGDAALASNRVGRDGRVRPVNGAAGRRLAEELIADRPHASLREIARAAGVAPSTVKSVRERVQSGLDPVPDNQHSRRESSDLAEEVKSTGSISPKTVAGTRRSRRLPSPVDRVAALQRLRKDPSLRFNEAGRILLQWLDSTPAHATQRARVLDGIPGHRLDIVIALARQSADAWQELADQLEQVTRDNVAGVPSLAAIEGTASEPRRAGPGRPFNLGQHRRGAHGAEKLVPADGAEPRSPG